MKKSISLYAFAALLCAGASAQPLCDGIITTDTIALKIHDGINCMNYSIVKIGSQWWMTENVNAALYSDSTPLVDGTGAGDITGDTTTKYYFNYANDTAYSATYGKLYTWAAAMNGAASSDLIPSGVQGVCPTGWHLPSDAEWKQLEMELGMSQASADSTSWRGTDEGGKLKETDTIHWASPNTGATNTSGFTALPGGYRSTGGSFFSVGGNGLWWSSKEYNGANAWYRVLTTNNAKIGRGGYVKSDGVSCRCVKGIDSFDNLTISVSSTNATCGSNNGSATANVTGGIPPYEFQWSSGDTLATADSLSSGIYMVTVTDASGSSAFAPAMINDAGAPAIIVDSVTNVSCNGGNNGAIDISVTGGSSPYTYEWANGYATQDISALSPGPYEIIVTDASGCKAMESINVSQPAPISHFISTTNASCGNPDGTATDSASGGTPPYSYSWNTSPVQNTASATGISAGSYIVTVMDNNGCSDSAQATIVNFGSAVATIDSIIPAVCGSGTGSIYISVTGGSPPFTYLWSNGDTTQDLVGVAPGMYGLTIYGSNPCTGAFSAALPSSAPATQMICLVTVDTLTGTNLIVWEKQQGTGIASYNIYKESTQAGVYYLIGNRLYDLLSVFTDTFSNPIVRSWRYKITAVDSCGSESPKSAEHKTIHLVLSNFGNYVYMIWDDYQGFDTLKYHIHRYSTPGGWEVLDSLGSNYKTYTDTAQLTGYREYFIEARPPAGCTATKKAENYNSSKSNTATSVSPSGVSESGSGNLDLDFMVYPNPSKGVFTLYTNNTNIRIVVYDVLGREILEYKIKNRTSEINLSNQPVGIYHLQIVTEKTMYNMKLIIDY